MQKYLRNCFCWYMIKILNLFSPTSPYPGILFYLPHSWPLPSKRNNFLFMSLMEILLHFNPFLLFQGTQSSGSQWQQCLKISADIKIKRYWNIYLFKFWHCSWDKEIKLLWLIVLQFFLYLKLDPTPMWGESPMTHIGGNLMWYPIHFFGGI